jgi:hypothetical protein
MSLIFNPSRSQAAETTTAHSHDLVSFSEAAWLQPVIARKPRPNLLVLCQDTDTESVARGLMQMCAPPLHVGRLPGALELPPRKTGTLLLHDVAALTVAQQIELFDWIGGHVGTTQVISVTSTPLLARVEDGRFFEGLYYRLNVVYVRATVDRAACSGQCKRKKSISASEFQ